MTTLAAIDIGSNGARLLIKRFDPEAPREEDRIKKIMFIRIPLRLGKDVFTLGKVSKEREKMMLHMMKGFKQFMKLNDVDAFRACATSAMRDAENGKKVLKKNRKADWHQARDYQRTGGGATALQQPGGEDRL